MLKFPNLTQSVYGLDLWIKRQQIATREDYRDLIREIFNRLLRNTPQYSGHAVSSWNIGVGAPDLTPSAYKSDVGEPELESAPRASGRGYYDRLVAPDNVREKGDRRAMDYARKRNWPKLEQVNLGTKVYFSNTAMGDMDGSQHDREKGKGQVFYLEALQDPAYWVNKLREVNKPYETANETILAVQEWLLAKHGMSFKPGGATWQEGLT